MLRQAHIKVAEDIGDKTLGKACLYSAPPTFD